MGSFGLWGLSASVLNTAESNSKHPRRKRQACDPSREGDFGRMRRCQDALSVSACWIYVSLTSTVPWAQAVWLGCLPDF